MCQTNHVVRRKTKSSSRPSWSLDVHQCISVLIVSIDSNKLMTSCTIPAAYNSIVVYDVCAARFFFSPTVDRPTDDSRLLTTFQLTADCYIYER